MHLIDLINAINETLKVEKRHPKDIEVVITTQLPYITCGQLPCVGVRCVGMGFDWEAGQFRITPEDELMAVKHDVPQKVMEWQGNYHCPKCEHMLSKGVKKTDIRFCSKCGRAVKWNDSD